MGGIKFINAKPYDIFISYVVEDREYVESLVNKLTTSGYKVWYARRELLPGSDIFNLINEGLENSRFGIAIISADYKSRWAYGELFALEKMKDRFIPILHNVSVEQVYKIIQH